MAVKHQSSSSSSDLVNKDPLAAESVYVDSILPNLTNIHTEIIQEVDKYPKHKCQEPSIKFATNVFRDGSSDSSVSTAHIIIGTWNGKDPE